jgi:hypothetical protein
MGMHIQLLLLLLMAVLSWRVLPIMHGTNKAGIVCLPGLHVLLLCQMCLRS